jgi:Acetyltransferase (GNAT) domain
MTVESDQRAGAATSEAWRPGTLDDELLALRAGVWGAEHPHTSPAFFSWMFGAANPAGKGSGVVLRRGERVLGFMGLCPRRVRFHGRDVTAAHCLDYMVDREIGPGASARYALRLAQAWAKVARAEGHAFGIGFPNQNSYRIVTSDRIGWRDILRPRLMVRPLRGGRLGRVLGGGAGGLARRLGLSLGGAALDLAAGLRRRPPGEVRTLAPSGEASAEADARAIDALWQRRRDDAPASIVRDAAALRWRYREHPFRRYEILGWQAGDGLSALIVTTRRDLEGLPALLIVDAVADPAAPSAARALIAAALRRAAGEGDRLAAAEAQPGSPLARALAQAGFLTVPRRFDPKPFTLVGLPLDTPMEQLAGPWQFAWGDMDVV